MKQKHLDNSSIAQALDKHINAILNLFKTKPKLNDCEEANSFLFHIKLATTFLGLPMPDIYYCPRETLKDLNSKHACYLSYANILLVDDMPLGKNYSLELASAAVYVLHCAYQECVDGRPHYSPDDATEFVEDFNITKMLCDYKFANND